LSGIEVIHSDHSESDSRKFMNFAKNNNLIMTGGSDFHGANKDNAYIGKPCVDDRIFDKLNSCL